jgi:hypothetical protein
MAMTAKAPNTSAPQQLLYTRQQVRVMLGNVSYATVRRLEKAGELKPIRLKRNRPTARVYYKAANVLALANEGAAYAEA